MVFLMPIVSRSLLVSVWFSTLLVPTHIPLNMYISVPFSTAVDCNLVDCQPLVDCENPVPANPDEGICCPTCPAGTESMHVYILPPERTSVNAD